MNPADATTFKLIPKYTDAEGNTVELKPINNVPGFTHRVIVNHKACDYLGNDLENTMADDHYRSTPCLD